MKRSPRVPDGPIFFLIRRLTQESGSDRSVSSETRTGLGAGVALGPGATATPNEKSVDGGGGRIGAGVRVPAASDKVVAFASRPAPRWVPRARKLITRKKRTLAIR
ncbi:MAG: hypothetical protein ABI016_09430 [Chthoniobacterales bacterium]